MGEESLFWDLETLIHTVEEFLKAVDLTIWVPAELPTPPNYIDSNHFGVVTISTQEAGLPSLSPAKG